eukprot:TRINITY_DN27183_c0_g1_i1.p1 TRINITY_DN27183_c0_g1~~TRINITY_DN27183_c0_g1_i1.p1  ORF type:complete len:188 (+),score=62.95 TRINITY_DN27183_c0_g1_i1:34-597(+)
MADNYGLFNDGSSSRGVGNEDFDEEDVWAVMNERKDYSPKVKKSKDSSSSVPGHNRIPSFSKMIPKNNANLEGQVARQSAPVNIPDWSKIYRKKKGSETHGFMNGSWACDGDDDGLDGGDHYGIDDADDYDDEDDDDKVPPHEWLAKKVARSQISSSSVCEGAGRTLKGRDLSKVRNAALSKTGFLE